MDGNRGFWQPLEVEKLGDLHAATDFLTKVGYGGNVPIALGIDNQWLSLADNSVVLPADVTNACNFIMILPCSPISREEKLVSIAN